MRYHLLLSSKSPFNWHSIVKIVNAHKPSFISFCHFEDQPLDLGKLVIPIEMQGLFSDIEFEHINMKLDEKYTEKKGLQKRMDIRLGATFSHILINEMVGDDLAVYCTNYRGNKLIRMDKQECFEVENINPLKVLEMSGVSFSMNKVSNQPFEFKEFLPQIIERGNKFNLKSSKLIEMGEFNSDTLKVKLTDSNGSTIEIDSREEHGYWLEDIVMRQIAMNYPNHEVYTDVTRNQKTIEKQIKYGLKRALFSLDESIPILKEEIINFYSKHGVNILEEEIGNLHDVNVEDFRKYVSEFVYELVYKMGAKNEFDGLCVSDDGIITIEIKSTQPSIQQLEKLESFSKHLSPVRGNSNILIYNCIWERTPKGHKKRDRLNKSMKISKSKVMVFACQEVVPSLSPTNK